MPDQALKGLRVLELGPYVALPLTGRILASLGAEVIKVETNKVLDEMAFIPAWSRGAGQPEFQRNKKRISLDVRTPDGLKVFRQLLNVSDVFMTNFRRNILSRWGIDFTEVRSIRPDIVVMWQTGLGGIGPYYTYKSYGILVQHMGGVSLMSGEEGEPPATINTSYSDYHTGVFQPAAIVGALMRRALTGNTATMESSIFKSGAVTAGPAILDFQVNQHMPRRIGNRDLCMAPHGVYPCKGEDNWCAIAVQNETQWETMVNIMGAPDWINDVEFATIEGRLENHQRLDWLIGEWTKNQSAGLLMQTMQDAGIPASIVSKGQDLNESRHLKDRGFYQPSRYFTAERDKPAYDWVEGEGIASVIPARMSNTPMEYGYYHNIGEDNEYVYGEVLGLTSDEIQRMTENGAFY